MEKPRTYSIPFNYFHHEFRCFWGAFHVKEGTLILGIIQLALTMFFCTAFFVEIKFDSVWDLFEISTLLLEFTALVLLFIGLVTKKSLFLLPYIIYQTLCTLFLICVIVWGFFIFVDSQGKIGRFILRILLFITDSETLDEETGQFQQDKENNELLTQFPIWFTILFCIILFFISAWCVSVVSKCYKYFKQLARTRQNNSKNVNLPLLNPDLIHRPADSA